MTGGAESDEALLERITERDEEALHELYRRFAPRLGGFLRSRLNDPVAIDDVINVVMLEVWKSASRFEGRSSAASWILSIARHRAIDQMRKSGGHDHDEIDESIEAPDAGAEMLLDAAADAARVRECIEELPRAQREAVHLAFFEELAYGEIARVMDCPPGTVKTRVFHAKRALKRCLERITGATHA